MFRDLDLFSASPMSNNPLDLVVKSWQVGSCLVYGLNMALSVQASPWYSKPNPIILES